MLGGSAGERGKVSLSDGLAQRLDNLLNDVLSGDGPLNGRTESLNKQVDRLGDEREKLDTRMTSLESRYRAQFMAMDKDVYKRQSLTIYALISVRSRIASPLRSVTCRMYRII